MHTCNIVFIRYNNYLNFSFKTGIICLRTFSHLEQGLHVRNAVEHAQP